MRLNEDTVLTVAGYRAICSQVPKQVYEAHVTARRLISAMSQVGHSCRFPDVRVMSGLLPIADVMAQRRDRREGLPEAPIALASPHLRVVAIGQC